VVEDDERLYTVYQVADGIIKDEIASPPDLGQLFRVVELSRRTLVDAYCAGREPDTRAA